MAAETNAVRELWCELLSSDIYKNSKDYNKNMSSHHFSMQVSASFYNAFFVKNILGLRCRFLSYTSVLISKTMPVSLLRTSVSKCDQMINRYENQRCNELF